MTAYRAIVKVALDATPEERVTALVKGIEECALELVGDELGKDFDFLENALDDARSAAEHELEMRRFRSKEEGDRG